VKFNSRLQLQHVSYYCMMQYPVVMTTARLVRSEQNRNKDSDVSFTGLKTKHILLPFANSGEGRAAGYSTNHLHHSNYRGTGNFTDRRVQM
jgi:hypothetical protein